MLKAFGDHRKTEVQEVPTQVGQGGTLGLTDFRVAGWNQTGQVDRKGGLQRRMPT